MDKTDFIFKELRSSHGGDESSRLFTCTSISTGETEIIVEKTITERMPVQNYEKAERMYKQLNGGGGRRCIKIEDLVKLSWK